MKHTDINAQLSYSQKMKKKKQQKMENWHYFLIHKIPGPENLCF